MSTSSEVLTQRWETTGKLQSGDSCILRAKTYFYKFLEFCVEDTGTAHEDLCCSIYSKIVFITCNLTFCFPGTSIFFSSLHLLSLERMFM